MIRLCSKMLQCGLKAPHYSNKALFQGCLMLAILLIGGQHVAGEGVECTNMDVKTNQFKLFLLKKRSVLEMTCSLVKAQGISQQHYRDMLKVYTTAGVLPKMEIYNRTNSFSFQFKLNQETISWHVSIPRNNITINRAVAPLDQWYVEINLFQGYDALDANSPLLQSLKGTLLDLVREPILQWDIGDYIHLSHVYQYKNLILRTTMAQSPCASDVAVIGPIFAYSPIVVPGVIVGVTSSAFLQSGGWFNLTNSLCSSLSAADCYGLALIDLKLTNCHLFLLTNRGLFVSQDLLSPITGPLSFTRPFNPILAQINPATAKIWHSVNCQTSKLYFSDDYVSVTSNTGYGPYLVSRCAFSGYPFTNWYTCQGSDYDMSTLDFFPRYLAFLYDHYQNTALLLSLNEKNPMTGMVSMFNMGKTGLDYRTKVPSSFLHMNGIVGVFMRGNHVFLYGKQLWTSDDGGAKFHLLLTLDGEDHIIDMISCPYNNLVVGFSFQGMTIILRAGLDKYSKLTFQRLSSDFIYCDHMGVLTILQLDAYHESGFRRVIFNTQFIQTENFKFPGHLSPQYITPSTVLLFEHSSDPGYPSAGYLLGKDVGKIVTFSQGGKILITDVYAQPPLQGIFNCAKGEILQPFKTLYEPIQNFPLLYQGMSMGNEVIVSITAQGHQYGFHPSHVGLSVVCPGHSTLLIFQVVNGVAWARATMPSWLPLPSTIRPHSWILVASYNYNLHEQPCRHKLQSLDKLRHNALLFINVHEKLSFTFKTFMTGTQPTERYKKRMVVALTNPTGFRVTVDHFWDKSNNHMLNLTVFSHLCKKATTMVTVYIPEASLMCSTTAFTFTLLNTCPEGLSIVYLPSRSISDYEWLHGDPEDENDNKIIYNLPVNYRPPSKLGLLIPTTENIYNADPSQPMPRQHYPVSKNTGRYKHCAEKASVEECGCTDMLRVSPLAINSDCRQRVLRKIYPLINFNITLFLRRVNHPDQPLRSPYFVTVTEVNNRTNWAVTGTQTTSTLIMMRELLKTTLNQTFYNPEGLKISCYGPELYHFRISVIPGVVLCDLVDEVQIFVDKGPLGFPAAYVISCITAIGLGGLLMLGLLLKNAPVPNSVLKSFCRDNKVAPELN